MQAILDAARIASFVTEVRVRSTVSNSPKGSAKFGTWLRGALAKQGPTFVKAGQFLSSRNDVLPRNVAHELRTLQDNVSPMDFDQVQRLINKETGRDSIWDVFDSFQPAPVASASIGQVHRARLKGSNVDVAVKIQKPNVLGSFRRDITAMRMLVDVGAKFGMRGGTDATHVLNDLEIQLEAESDFTLEAANTLRFREACKHFHWLKVPRPIDDICTKRLLVMEFIDYDFKTSNMPENFERKYITAHRLVELMMWMVLDGGILHCDMHPGNLCMKEDGTLVLYDFGTVLDITPKHRQVMQELATHMYNNDAKQTVDVMLSSGLMTMKDGCKPEDAEKFFSVVIQSTRSDFDATKLQSNMGEPPFIAAMSIFRLFRTMMLVEAACKYMDPGFSYFKYMRPFLGAQMAMMKLWQSLDDL